MADARTVVEQARRETTGIEDRLKAHPYLLGLEARRIPKERLRIFAEQQSHIIASDLRSVALAAARAGTARSREFFFGMLQGERAAAEALGALARGLGMTPEAAAAAEPLAGPFAYTAYVAWLALYASEAEFAGAFLINLPAWGANCAAMSRLLKANYGLTDSDVAFFDLFATPSEAFEQGALAVITEGLERGVDPRRIQRAARLLQDYEFLYWDTIHQASTT
ncbi:MAG: transcriptional regulator [Candidatus Rokubacteria bacterium]|nr:transcriptional regulator [Candidatus Rokubacteria bacterium]